jgi:hypothetical protein
VLTSLGFSHRDNNSNSNNSRAVSGNRDSNVSSNKVVSGGKEHIFLIFPFKK